MDSGNSGSMQSSSGGGSEEYDDSRGELISAFLNNNAFSSHNIGHGGQFVGLQPPTLTAAPSLRQYQQQQQQHQSLYSSSSAPPMFDPLSNYLGHPNLSSRSSLLNLDHVVWPAKYPRSDNHQPNCTDLLGGFVATSPPPSPPNQRIFLAEQQQQTQNRATTFNYSMAAPISQGPGSSVSATTATTTATNNNNNAVAVRNLKKRSRASRRAPTTVLTTDTNNFRAMVQEFTGIPASPFTTSSLPFPRTGRFDLFGTPNSSSQPVPPHYNLLRTFAHKIHPPSSSSAQSSNNINCSSTSINYQLPSSSEIAAGFLKLQPAVTAQSTLFNINNNPILNFQSLLQTPPKYPLSNSTDSPLKMGVFEEFGLSQQHGGHVTGGGIQNLVSTSDGAFPINGEETGALLRVSSNNGKVNNFVSSASSSDFHGEKGTAENVSTRGEGMVEPWIHHSS